MKQHLNTLFVMTAGAWVHKDGENVVVEIERQERLRLPLLNLDGICCYGQVHVSPPLMGACAERGVRISFLDMNGRFLAAVNGYASGNVLLRREQYRVADDGARSVRIAREIVAAKIANTRSVLMRAQRDHGARVETATRRMADLIQLARRCQDLDTLRGHEGEAASLYFSVFSELVTVPSPHGDPFRINRRTRRPPLDQMNALLSFLYTILMHDMRSAAEASGLDAAVGFLHRDRPGRPGLALDLMEPFRSLLADRLALSLVNRRQVTTSGFRATESGAIEMDDETRKEVVRSWQQRKQEEIQHPFLDERMTIGVLLHVEARLLARHIRGDLDSFPPFISGG